MSGSVLMRLKALKQQQPQQQANNADDATAADALYYCATMMHL